MRLEGLGRVVQYPPQDFVFPGETSVHGNGSELGDCKDVKPVGAPPATVLGIALVPDLGHYETL